MTNKNFILYIRNFIFGAEDSLVSTVGLLSGIASAGISRADIIISGVVLIFVEAFSMSVGSFLSERATEESESNFNQADSKSGVAAVIMFISYLVCGLIPLFPYLFSANAQAFWHSNLASLIALFVLGLVSAKILKTNLWKNAVRMLVIGGVAIGLGAAVGMLISR